MEETLELFKSDIGSVPNLMDLPFRVITILREARIERYKAEAKRQEEIRKKQEREQIRNQILKK